MNWSKNKAFLTGANGSYSTDDEKGTNELTNPILNNAGNYQQAYQGGMMGSTLLGMPDYNNQGNLLHNNVGSNVMREQIFETVLFLDNSLRDCDFCGNPFVFNVKFNGIKASTEAINFTYNDEMYFYNTHVKGDRQLVLPYHYRNCRALWVNRLIMPKTVHFISEDGEYKPDLRLDKVSSSYRYLVVAIEGLPTQKRLSTNCEIGCNSWFMSLDKDCFVGASIYIPMYFNDKLVFYDSALQSLDKLTIKVLDDKCKLIYPTLDGKPFDFCVEYKKTIDRAIGYAQQKKMEKIEALMPKLRSLKKVVEYISPEIHISIALQEVMLNTIPNYQH